VRLLTGIPERIFASQTVEPRNRGSQEGLIDGGKAQE
jgi:hypothetical protein